MIGFSVTGNTNQTDSFLEKMMHADLTSRLAPYCQAGVEALRTATPQDTGRSADSWSYEIVNEGGKTTIWWKNSNIVDGFPVVIGLQYGHATGTGGYVPGHDFINPALKPIFDKISNSVWEEVQRA